MISNLLPAALMLQDAGQAAPADTTMLRVICGVLALVLLGIVVLRRKSKKKKEEEF